MPISTFSIVLATVQYGYASQAFMIFFVFYAALSFVNVMFRNKVFLSRCGPVESKGI